MAYQSKFNRAVLVNVSVGGWETNKKSRNATGEVLQDVFCIMHLTAKEHICKHFLCEYSKNKSIDMKEWGRKGTKKRL